MGAALFERTTRRVNLTQAGQVFLDEARRVLSAAKIARSVVADMQSLQRGRLMIGAIQGLSPFIDLPKLLGDFHREYPNIEIRLSFDETGALIEGVVEGRLDIAFTQFVEVLPAELMAKMLACDPLVLACPSHHACAGQQELAACRHLQEKISSICRSRTARANWSIRVLPRRDCRAARPMRLMI